MNHSLKALPLGGRLLTGAAAAVALYLAAMALGRSALPGCESGSPCQDALTSQWAYVFGMPVSFAGFVLYSGMLWMSSAFIRRQGNLADAVGWMAGVLIPLAALWFTGVQVLLLPQLCLWCCLAHGLATGGVVLLWMSRRKAVPLPNPGVWRIFTSAGIAGGAAVLVAGALLVPPPQADFPVLTQHSASPDGGLVSPHSTAGIEASGFPNMGRSDAVATSYLLSDFTSPQCLRLHAAIDALAQRRKDFRVVVLPAAFTPAAADIQRTLLTLWHVDPAKWHAAAALLSSRQIQATPDAVEKCAILLAGAARFSAASYESAACIGAQMATADRLQAGHPGAAAQALPTLIQGDHVLSGLENDPAILAAFLTGGAAAAPTPVKEAPEPPRERESAPLMTILNPQVDLRTMSQGQPVDVEIKVQNRGNSPLQLGWLETDKGCFVTALPSEKIRPGLTASIHLKVHPPQKAGVALKRLIRIHSNSPGQPGELVLLSTLAPALPPAAARTASGPRPATASIP